MWRAAVFEVIYAALSVSSTWWR